MHDVKKDFRSLQNYTNEELFVLYKSTGRIDIKQEIALRYLDTIKKMVVRMSNVYMGFLQIEDVINEGIVTLMTAIDKFDLDKNIKFETFIAKRIRGAVIDMSRAQDIVSRATRHEYKEICAKTNEFYTENGREPSTDEICDILEMDKEKYYKTMNIANTFAVVSLDEAIEKAEDSHGILKVKLMQEGTNPEQKFLDDELKIELAKAITKLSEKEQLVLSLYYNDELNMKEIAHVIEVSEPRVSQIHSGAIKKLKMYLSAVN